MIVNNKKNILGFFLIYILFALSCVEKTHIDDYKILEFVLNENNFKIEDSIFFINNASNKRVIDFFGDRNKEFFVIQPIAKNQIDVKTNDSVIDFNRKLIQNISEIKTDNYIIMGKGINKDAEEFLKDTFNYKIIDSITWNLNGSHKNNFLSEREIAQKSFSISKPLYNLDKNKSIVFTKKSTISWRDRTLYFLKKIDDKWILVYKENRK
ncbi:MAG: hypothetical protein ED556_11200 [Winogradskyella sp.]|uniref:hypothetical protein n=1 Tax=Winogradskyella sp. TaxID=1883156 RepID=UPI000F3ADD15|nr:hypothetical protein [Winogradskyella sp.]RNC85125.1 MAG: hypothetical protein ED556_11200 [Winogradskyella sp.]